MARIDQAFCHGDRVRIKTADSEYTGCRGTICKDPAEAVAGVASLGFFVAIDGENGRTRPFLATDLELLQVARVRRPAVAAKRAPSLDPHR